LTQRLPVVSRTGRTEYQLLLMKASDRGRNVKFSGNNVGCLSNLNNNKHTVIADMDVMEPAEICFRRMQISHIFNMCSLYAFK